MSTAKKKDLNSLGSVYGDMLNGVKRSIVKENKVKPGEIGEAPLEDGGPLEKRGFVKTKLDKEEMSEKELEDNLYNINDLSYDEDEEKCDCDEDKECTCGEKADEKTQKIAKESLNNFMRKKSIFDKLYENVMFGGQNAEDNSQELDELGIGDSTPDDELEDEGGEGEVTITLDRETAKKLHDILMTAIGGETEDETEFETETETEDEDEMDMDEDEEDGEPSPFSKGVDYGKNNKVGNVKPVGGTASSATTDKVGNDGDLGHFNVNAKQPNMGKQNKVGNLKSGQGAFQ